MKQEDRLSFVDAMEKGIHDNKEGGHWTVDHHNNLPQKAHPIKSIWSFKRKHKPDGQLLKHKARLCACGDMKQYCALRSAGWACGRGDLPANFRDVRFFVGEEGFYKDPGWCRPLQIIN